MRILHFSSQVPSGLGGKVLTRKRRDIKTLKFKYNRTAEISAVLFFWGGLMKKIAVLLVLFAFLFAGCSGGNIPASSENGYSLLSNKTLGWGFRRTQGGPEFSKEQIRQMAENNCIYKENLKETGEYIISNYLENDINKELRLVVSLVVSTAIDTDQMAYENMAEIIEYKNSIGRRITDLNVVPGNLNPENSDNTENDTGIAQRVIIMPPLGGDKSNTSEKLMLNSEECINYKRKRFGFLIP